MMNWSRTPKTDSRRLEQQLDDETVLIHLQSERVFVLNHTGSRFWELLSEGNSLGQIRARMLDEFDVTEEQLSQEIEDLLAELIREGFVHIDE